MRKNGHTTTIEDENLEATRTIRLVYCGPVNEWNHYVSFCRFDKLYTLTLGDTPNPNEEPNSTATPVAIHGGRCYVIEARQDGNCLFSAFAHQMFCCTMNGPIHKRYAVRLRGRVMNYIRERINEQRFMNLLDDRIDMEYSALNLISDREEARRRLLDILERPAVWCGNESVTAMARMFRCTVVTLW